MSNDGQREYWNGKAGETWVAWQARLDALLAPLSDAAIDKAALRAGERVIDIGCGCGTTTRQLAERGAAVWGIDISAPMLAHAKARFKGVPSLAFSQTDASSQAFTPDHQLLFSRFGVMFFDQPVAAFRNLRTGLTPEGRLVFLCWQEMAKNPWIAIAGRAVQPFLPPPAEPAPGPSGPDPFAFADTEYVAQILEQSGFRDIAFEALTPQLHVADDLDDAIAFQTTIGPLARVLAELQGEARDRALEAARAALSAHVTEDGLRLGAAAWLVTARAE
ncbi:MAG: class I SAM-dependent methyltransferase [Pseudomonadales bacterium]